MERPTDTLAKSAAAFAERVSGLDWTGRGASLAEVADGFSDSDLLALLEEFGHIKNLVDAVGARFAGVAAARSARGVEEPLAKRMGERSAAAAVAAAARLPMGEAIDWCQVGVALAPRHTLTGETLPVLHPAVSAALDDGTLCLQAARLILNTLSEIAPLQSVEELVAREEFLVAEAGIVGVAGLRRLCQRILDQVDPDGTEPREEELRAKAGARVVKRRDGMTRYLIDADPERAGFFNAAIDAQLNPRRDVRFGEDGEEEVDEALADDRTRSEKVLDGFVNMARALLKQDPGDMSGTAVTLLMTADHEAITTGLGAATIFGEDQPISAATARRLACEAQIIPFIMNSSSVPLDVGWAKRLFTEAQRYAMALRDGGCVWPGCPEPPARCQAAHITPWRDTRRTDLDNGVLFCPFHHRRFDLDGWGIQFREGVPWLIPPPHIDATRRPRRCNRRTANLPA